MEDIEQPLIQRLPDAILKHRVLCFLGSRREIACFSGTCRAFHSLLVSPSCAKIWDEACTRPFKVCIDGYCPSCRSSGSVESAIQFLSHFPILRLNIHCFLTHIPVCMESLAQLDLVESLQLSLTNKSSSPPLDTLLAQSGLLERLAPTAFSRLTDLSLDSSHLHHVKLAGRARLLDLLGRHLRHLRFEHLSPSGVFSIVSTRCPVLTSLRVDKATTLPDFQSFSSCMLLDLELLRCHFIPSIAHLKQLKKFKFSAAFRMEECQIKALILAFPSSMEYLSVEIPGAHVNVAVRMVAKRLPNILSLSLESSFEKGLISRNMIEILGARCLALQEVELKCSRSVASLCFESPDAFTALGAELRALRCLRVMLDEVVTAALPRFLALFVNDGPHIQIFVQARWMSPSLWQSTLQYVAELCRQFPQCKLSLESNFYDSK